METPKDRGPGVKVPPPLIVLFFIGCGYGINGLMPIHLGDLTVLKVIGASLCIISFIIALITALQFFKAKTHIEPWQPADKLLLSGVFRYSRNPIYLSFLIFTLGLGLYLDNLWIVFSVFPIAFSLIALVIIKEERYLAKRFPDQYPEYCQKVRRWL